MQYPEEEIKKEYLEKLCRPMNCGFIADTFILENGRKRIANTVTWYTCTVHARLRGTQARNIFLK
jgi:hypothetical protein